MTVCGTFATVRTPGPTARGGQLIPRRGEDLLGFITGEFVAGAEGLDEAVVRVELGAHLPGAYC